MKVSKKNKIIAAIIAVIILSIGYIMQLNGVFSNINNQLHQIFAPQSTTQQTQSTEQTQATESTTIAQTKITQNEAVNIALKHANVDRSEISFLHIEKEFDNGITVYEIDFNVDLFEYDYTINEANGEILEYSIGNE